MGFFSGNNNSYSTSSIEDLMEQDLNTYDGMTIMEANYAALAESEMNWNMIVEAAAETELSYYAQTGEEYVYTEASGFVDSVVAFVKKVWEKVKAIFKKFLVLIGQFVYDDKDFVNKYKETILKNVSNIPSNATIQGYPFEKTRFKTAADGVGATTDISALMSDTAGTLTTAVTADWHFDDNDKYESSDVNEALRRKTYNGVINSTTDSSPMDESDFKKDLFEWLHGDTDSKESIDLTASSVSEAIAELYNAKTTRDIANKAYRNAEKAFKVYVKKAEELEKNEYKKKPGTGSDAFNATEATKRTRVAAHIKAITGFKQTACSILTSAVKDFYKQQKAICVKAVTYRNKTGTNESAGFGYDDYDNRFAAITLK